MVGSAGRAWISRGKKSRPTGKLACRPKGGCREGRGRERADPRHAKRARAPRPIWPHSMPPEGKRASLTERTTTTTSRRRSRSRRRRRGVAGGQPLGRDETLKSAELARWVVLREHTAGPRAPTCATRSCPAARTRAARSSSRSSTRQRRAEGTFGRGHFDADDPADEAAADDGGGGAARRRRRRRPVAGADARAARRRTSQPKYFLVNTLRKDAVVYEARRRRRCTTRSCWWCSS